MIFMDIIRRLSQKSNFKPMKISVLQKNETSLCEIWRKTVFLHPNLLKMGV